MRLLFFLLAPIFSYPQVDRPMTYHTKEVHTIGWRSDTTTSSWRIDTIHYSVPFEIKQQYAYMPLRDGSVKLVDSSLLIDGYGLFKIDSVKQKYNSPYWNYWLAGGKQFALIEKIGYLNYPTVNKKSQIIVFYID